MQFEELRTKLNEGPHEERWAIIEMLDKRYFTEELFDFFIEWLSNEDDLKRFFALYHLIDKFRKRLTKIEGKAFQTIYALLYDKKGPVIDRAIWAMEIIGDRAFDQMKVDFQQGTIERKSRILTAFGRGKFSNRIEERMEFLLAGLRSNSSELRYVAMCEIMTNSPLSPPSLNEWYGNSKSIDYEVIYKQVLPIARDFMDSGDQNQQDFSNRYIQWIENRKVN